MEYPYCTVDGVKYQLEMVDGVLRFPDHNEECDDLNGLLMSYYRGDIDLEVVWRYYSRNGNSYDLVEGYFSPHGINNHTVTQGSGKCKRFVLHSGNKETDESWNYTENDELYYDARHLIDNLNENFDDLSKDEILRKLTEIRINILQYKEE